MIKLNRLLLICLFCKWFLLYHNRVRRTGLTYHPYGLVHFVDSHLNKMRGILELLHYLIECLLHQDAHITSRESLCHLHNILYLLLTELIEFILKSMENHVSSRALIRQWNVYSSGKPSYYGSIKRPWQIGCSQNHRTIIGIRNSIHLSKEFCLHLFGGLVLIVRSCRDHWIDFVNKNNWVLALSGSVKNPLDLFLWVTNVLGHDVCWADWEEGCVWLCGTGLGQEGLSCSRRTVQEHSLPCLSGSNEDAWKFQRNENGNNELLFGILQSSNVIPFYVGLLLKNCSTSIVLIVLLNFLSRFILLIIFFSYWSFLCIGLFFLLGFFWNWCIYGLVFVFLFFEVFQQSNVITHYSANIVLGLCVHVLLIVVEVQIEVLNTLEKLLILLVKLLIWSTEIYVLPMVINIAQYLLKLVHYNYKFT